jgi:hypothetical protein
MAVMMTARERLMKKRISTKRKGKREWGVEIHFHTEGNGMRCMRWGGAMVYEKFYGDCEHFFGWRCVVCGEIIDQVILENRFVHIR